MQRVWFAFSTPAALCHEIAAEATLTLQAYRWEKMEDSHLSAPLRITGKDARTDRVTPCDFNSLWWEPEERHV